MRIAIYQGPDPRAVATGADVTPSGIRDHNLAAIARTAAAAAGADLLVCPEMSTTGYNIGAATCAELAETPDGPIFQRLRDVAREHAVAIAYGYPERAPEGVYNAVRVVGADGAALANYRKCHLFGELDRRQFLAGADPLVQFTLAGARVGVLTCYDVEFPEAVRAHAIAGADVLVVPTGNMEPYERVNTLLVPARAMESQLFVAYVNRCGSEGDVHYCGRSCMVGPDGADIVRAGLGEELLYADLDLDLLARSRRANPYLTDRRPELYAAITDAPAR